MTAPALPGGGQAIHTIDLLYRGRRGSIAAYVIDAPRGPVMIECGPQSTVENLRRGLAELGWQPSDVRHVLVTHIHFDHAGAAGWMARHGAQIHVHEFGARHLVDPSKLNASARRVYGDQMEALWGEIIPSPTQQVTAVHDGDMIDANGIEIRAVETPGHARHHHAFVIEDGAGRIGFTGDAGACWVAEAPQCVTVPLPPPELDIEAWHGSIDRLLALDLAAAYPTHFGRLDDPQGHLRRLSVKLDEHAACVRRLLEEGVDEPALRARYRAWYIADAKACGLPPEKMSFYVTDTLADMNVDGLLRYWSKQAESINRTQP